MASRYIFDFANYNSLQDPYQEDLEESKDIPVDSEESDDTFTQPENTEEEDTDIDTGVDEDEIQQELSLLLGRPTPPKRTYDFDSEDDSYNPSTTTNSTWSGIFANEGARTGQPTNLNSSAIGRGQMVKATRMAMYKKLGIRDVHQAEYAFKTDPQFEQRVLNAYRDELSSNIPQNVQGPEREYRIAKGWYTGDVNYDDSKVPHPEAGNRMTAGQYAQRASGYQPYQQDGGLISGIATQQISKFADKALNHLLNPEAYTAQGAQSFLQNQQQVLDQQQQHLNMGYAQQGGMSADNTRTARPINPLTVGAIKTLPEVTVRGQYNHNPFDAAGSEMGYNYVNDLTSNPYYKTSPWSVNSPAGIVEPLINAPGKFIDQATKTNQWNIKPSNFIDATTMADLKAPVMGASLLGAVLRKHPKEYIKRILEHIPQKTAQRIIWEEQPTTEAIAAQRNVENIHEGRQRVMAENRSALNRNASNYLTESSQNFRNTPANNEQDNFADLDAFVQKLRAERKFDPGFLKNDFTEKERKRLDELLAENYSPSTIYHGGTDTELEKKFINKPAIINLNTADEDIDLLNRSLALAKGNWLKEDRIKDVLMNVHSTKFLQGQYKQELNEQGRSGSLLDKIQFFNRDGVSYLHDTDGNILGNITGISPRNNSVSSSALLNPFHSTTEIGNQNKLGKGMYRGVSHGLLPVQGNHLTTDGIFSNTSILNPRTGEIEERRRAHDLWKSFVRNNQAKKTVDNGYQITKQDGGMGFNALKAWKPAAGSLVTNTTPDYAQSRLNNFGFGSKNLSDPSSMFFQDATEHYMKDMGNNVTGKSYINNSPYMNSLTSSPASTGSKLPQLNVPTDWMDKLFSTGPSVTAQIVGALAGQKQQQQVLQHQREQLLNQPYVDAGTTRDSTGLWNPAYSQQGGKYRKPRKYKL